MGALLRKRSRKKRRHRASRGEVGVRKEGAGVHGHEEEGIAKIVIAKRSKSYSRETGAVQEGLQGVVEEENQGAEVVARRIEEEALQLLRPLHGLVHPL